MKEKTAENVPLIPFPKMVLNVKKILRSTKAESDARISELQASNARKRQAKKAKT